MARTVVNTAVCTEEVPSERAGQRLDNYLATRLKGVPRSLIYRVIRTGQVRVNGRRARPAQRLQAGDRVRIPPVSVRAPGEVEIPAFARAAIAGRVLARTDDYLLLDKPAGMAVHAGSGLAWGLIDAARAEHPGEFLELVHRLDRDTSGCLLLARNPAALRELRRQFRNQEVDKRYLCLLDGRLPVARQRVDAPLAKASRAGERMMQVDAAGKSASTEFVVLEQRGPFSYVEAIPHTGRMHQIRAHAAAIGLPLAGDSRYASADSVRRWRERGLRRLFLHAHAIRFEAPGGESLQFACPLPEDLRAVLDALPED